MDYHNSNNVRDTRNPPRRRNNAALAVLLFFTFLVCYHLLWTTPTLEAISGRMSPDSNIKLTSKDESQSYTYIGTGRWQNRGFNLVNCLRSMLGDKGAYGESIEYTVRRLQLMYLQNDNRSSYDYLRELRGALYPSSNLAARFNGSNGDNGYLDFVTHVLPYIDAWEEVDSLLESLKAKKQDSRRIEINIFVEKARKGHAGAAAMLARQIVKGVSKTGSLITRPSPLQAASLDGPSIAVLKDEMNMGYVPSENIRGFELRKWKRMNKNATVPFVNLAFYKQRYEVTGKHGGPAVVIVRPTLGSTVQCIMTEEENESGGTVEGVEGITSFYECESRHESIEEESEDPDTERKGLRMWPFGYKMKNGTGKSGSRNALPVAGLLFGPDFVGGCKSASRMLDAFGPPPKRVRRDVLWSQEMQNAFSSVSASMKKQLYVASFDVASGQEGATKVRCDPVPSFWSSEDDEDTAKDNRDGELWQSYRDASSSGVGRDWRLSQCLVKLPSKRFPDALVTNQTVVGSPVHVELLEAVESNTVCSGFTGSTCTVSLNETTICELTCEHSCSYAVSRGVRNADGRRHPPACFDLERILETPIVRHNEKELSVAWTTQEEADPVRWARPGKDSFWKDGEEEPHSVSLVFTSDVHGRFFHECGPSYCYPGAPYIASVIQTVRTAASRSGRVGTAVLIDAGDATFGSQYNETLVGMTMNRLKYEAMALGNHEFDIGRRLDEFSDLVDFPIVSTNVHGVPFATDFIRVSLKGGSVLCLLGVSANEFNPLAGRNVSFSDEASVVQMARNLRSVHGCDHTGLLSHAGIEADKKFAESSEANLDVIVGGHSHVLMGVHSTDYMPESSEFGAVSDMGFPFYTEGNAPVAHTGANGRYLGLLRLYWAGTRLVFTQGGLLPLDASHGVFPDPDFGDWQSKLLQKVDHQDKSEATKVEIDNNLARNDVCGQTCRTQECLLGDLATDAMMSCVMYGSCSKYAKASETVATVALLESGTLRACVAPEVEDFSEILPWPNYLVLLTMTGASLRKMLEHGVKDMRRGQGGAFLQASGLKYNYRDTKVEEVFISKPSIRRPNHKRRRLLTFSAGHPFDREFCAVAGAEMQGLSLVDDALYLVVVTDWLASGGDGYGDIVSSVDAVTTETTLRESILEHAKSFPIIRTGSRSKSVDTKLTSSAKQGLSGFSGGALSFLVTYPLYTLFVQRSASKRVSFSFRDLFAGAMLGMIATALSEAIYFFVYSTPELGEFSAFTRSSIAAITNSIATLPLWVVVTHMQVKERGMSAVAVAKCVYEESGICGFFTGFSMNMVMCVFPVVRQVGAPHCCECSYHSFQALTALSSVGDDRLSLN